MIKPLLRKFDAVITPAKEVVQSLGIVFGDIGTSPIYTLAVIFAFIAPTPENVIGILSLISWTLILLVTIQYAWLAMSLSQKGEGGTIVLREILVPLLHTKRLKYIVTLLSFIGISFLIGDGVLTTAISILSAVEGLRYIPAIEHLNQNILILIACLISIALFTFQRKGTETVSIFFGPIMVVWFLTIGGFGLWWISHEPWVFQALNPVHGILFITQNGWSGFFVLATVILCATGGEALYTDMGHLGRIPIIRAWGFALVLLIFNYFGQGAFLLQHPSDEPFFEMISHAAPSYYILFLILSVVATVIASQAMISGIFSVVYQGITTDIMPKLKIDYTSRKLRSQIYIPFINWFLLILSLLAILHFRHGYNLANAYGFAATVTMTITSIMITTIFYLKENYGKMLIAGSLFLVNLSFILASTSKLAYGGYWSVLIALIPLSLILVYTTGKAKLYELIRPMTLHDFLERYNEERKEAVLIQGTGLFFSKGIRRIPSYMVHTMFSNNIMYEDNVIISMTTLDKPFGVSASFREEPLAPRLRLFEIRKGYMEIINLQKILKLAKIDPIVMFYGAEEIETKNIFWKIFSLIKKLTPSFVQFYKLPTDKLHGVVMRVEM
jgi:KUP system potassium uptake protein